MTFQEFFETDYKYRSYERKIGNAKYDYKQLCNLIGSSEVIELICVICGANGGVTKEKYDIMKELTNDRASQGSFASLVNAMYTPYTVGRVCKIFNKNRETINGAIALVLLFASIKGYLSNDDNNMINLIYYGK